MKRRRTLVVTVVALLAALASGFAPDARAAEPKAEFSLNFVNADTDRVTLHNADLLLRADVGTIQPLDKSGRAIVLAKTTPWSSYRVQARAKSARPMTKGDAFGLIAGAIDDKQYYLFRLIQKKGGLFGELLVQRDKQVTLVSDFLVGDLVPLAIDPTHWHELAVNIDATNLCAYLDGKQILTYGYGEKTIEYRPWGAGQERFKLAKAPASVEGAGERVTSEAALKSARAGWFWDEEAHTLDVKHAGDAAVVVRL